MKKSDALRRSFLTNSAAGLGSAWLASRWTGGLDAQEHVQQAVKSGLPAKLQFFSADPAAEVPDGLKTKQFFQQRLLEILDAAGATKKWAPPVGETRTGGHLMGSCRMGNDPKTSVVTARSFATSGRNHPTCTIEALACRAADNIIRSAKNGGLKSPVSS